LAGEVSRLDSEGNGLGNDPNPNGHHFNARMEVSTRINCLGRSFKSVLSRVRNSRNKSIRNQPQVSSSNEVGISAYPTVAVKLADYSFAKILFLDLSGVCMTSSFNVVPQNLSGRIAP
jgi:hypothetical protein